VPSGFRVALRAAWRGARISKRSVSRRPPVESSASGGTAGGSQVIFGLHRIPTSPYAEQDESGGGSDLRRAGWERANSVSVMGLRRRYATVLVACFLVVGSMALGGSVAGAHLPGTDGGPADRGCRPVINDRYYVGATGRVGCDRARAIARASIRRTRTFFYWRCTGRGTGFGHCHGSGPWRRSVVHWAVND
jgi:hypothetical protein